MDTTLLRRVPSLLITLLGAGSLLAQNPLPNPGFEEWVDGNPTGWTTNNNQFTGQPVSPNDMGHSGASAGRGTYLGLISAPIINTIDASSHPLPITQAYERLTFYYQLQLASTQGTEIFAAGAIFTDAGGATVGQAASIFQRTANTSTWTYADVPVTNTGSDPVGVNVSFTLNGPDAVVGSYFVVDDVALENGGTSGVQGMEQGEALGKAWPVPATDAVNLPFTLDKASMVAIDVLDALGRTVDRANLGTLAPGRYKQVLDVQRWEAGTYTVVLRTASGVHTQALVAGH